MQNKRRSAGHTSLEQLLVLALVGVAGVSGLGALGRAAGTAIAGDETGKGHGTAVPMAVAREAGIESAVRAVGEAATELSRGVAARIRGAARETDPFLRMDNAVPWGELDPAKAEAAATRAVELAQGRLSTLESRLRPRTITGTLRKLDTADAELQYGKVLIEHQAMMFGTPEWLSALDTVDEMATAFEEGVTNNERLQATLKRMDRGMRAKLLRGDKARYWRTTMDTFQREGVALPKASRARLTEINTELAELSRKFGKNLTAARKGFEVYVDDVATLDGMPAEYIERARASAEAAGKPGYRLSLFDGTSDQAQLSVHDAALRERVYRAIRDVATHDAFDNQPTIERLLALRAEKAEILGYKNFSDYVTADRMVKNGDAATAFIDDLAARTVPFVEQELEALRAFRKSVDGSTDLQAWDYKYWQKRWADTLIDSEVVRDYFPTDTVLDGVFKTAGELYGITFKEVEAPVWGEGVQTFKVFDENGRELGTIQMDLYAREGKSAGAWQETVKPGAGKGPTATVVIGNFDPPAPGEAGRLRIGEVETLFHEVGHALHALFGNADAKFGKIGGTNVAWDFVELPSQLMENFVWQDEVLAYLAKHHETKSPLPPELITALKIRRTAGAAMEQMRTLANSKVDLALHQTYNPATDSSASAFAERVARAMVPAGTPLTAANITNFSHIFDGGYASGYYGYKWAEVLDADAFTRFEAGGVLNRRTGNEFRRGLLSQGNRKDADQLFRDFMQRDPDPSALQRRLGFEK